MKTQGNFNPMKILALIIGAMLGHNVVHAAKPAYPCKNLKSSIEKMICKDAKLGKLDQKLQAEYKLALKNIGNDNLNPLKVAQRGWIKGRNECWKAADKRQCVVDSYNLRITELQVMAGSAMVPKPSGFDCGNNQILTVYFYNNTQLPVAVVNFADEQVKAYQALAASGAKYDGPNVSLWNKGDQVALTWHGKAYQCKQVPSSDE